MSIIVFYLTPTQITLHLNYTDNELGKALKDMEALRNSGMKHVVLSSELSNSVGRPGVSSVVNGKTPDGISYDWSKAHRSGNARPSDKTKIHRNDN